MLKRALDKTPRLKRHLRDAFYKMKGEIPICYDEISEQQIKEIVNKKNPIILEIGCNDGQHSLWLRDMFDSPTIYCFEPDPRAIERFKGKVGDKPEITLFQMAISDKNGSIEFFQSGGNMDAEQKDQMPEGWDLSGSIRKPGEHLELHPWISFDSKIEVPTQTLDSWCAEHGVSEIDFIWMDVQGAELDVFRAAAESLKRVRWLYTEYSDKELYEGQPNLKAVLESLPDFELVTRYPGDVLLRNRHLS